MFFDLFVDVGVMEDSVPSFDGTTGIHLLHLYGGSWSLQLRVVEDVKAPARFLFESEAGDLVDA